MMRSHWFMVAMALLFFGCTADGMVLWPVDDDNNGSGGTGGIGGNRAGSAVTSSVSVGAGPPSTAISSGTGGPEQFLCPTPTDPVCMCSAGQQCFCEPEPAITECNIDCIEGSCGFECNSDTQCSFGCGIGCTSVCYPGSDCEMLCEGDCLLTCLEGSACTLWSWGGVSEMYCDFGALCDCKEGCICTGPGCP